ncbi:MAG: hypothetical protein KTR21_08665 [Rhodobacteraceae bacterium]|nr:hypothetical protein [Paracoccaceae bacterium]
MWPRFWRGKASSGPRSPRVLLYSHDTFGLGHLRRSRAIAIALTEAFPDASILIVTGSPIVGRFDFPKGVDFVRVPGVVKLASGEYATHNLSLDIAETTKLREGLILATASNFNPDLVIVDKEPTGFRGEILPTLELMRSRGARLVLGLRDVLDEPQALQEEWARKQAMPAVESFYHEIWVYGLQAIYDPWDGLSPSQSTRRKTRFTGYLRREPPDWPDPAVALPERQPYVLITAGGGGDGEWLMDWALAAYEADMTLRTPAVMVFGPFMNVERRRDFERRAARYASVEVMSFDSRLERLMSDATGVVAMGGYNTFCEVLSFDKPAVIAPRTSPRLEQFIRAAAAERLGLIRMPPGFRPGSDRDTVARDPMVMAEAIRGIEGQPKPSAARTPGLLDGLPAVVERAAANFSQSQAIE